MTECILIAHDIRSTHNVGALLRTADGLGVKKVYLTGYTPYPQQANDNRLPHISRKLSQQIHKTALGAEQTVPWEHNDDIIPLLTRLKQIGWTVVALEQHSKSLPLNHFKSPKKLVLLLGREVEGIDPAILEHCDSSIEIPMMGKKESFNVVIAAAMALYHCKYMLL